ncbi:hypothetical protein ASE14_09180 [Agromyces sp. Root81]|uniref:hypothetical protein n=1 Tax=Agromyces sp. Root81 TaxID=1736601 RepID=UPI00070108BB|nr:hypothetical protein [Agromyces sp. Root81]KRC61100.1 hypothetical protein ASE14_09180 [Agromyces sp. Root81]
MTLTRILPTLRRSIPDPISMDRWPEATSVSTTDVSVGGVSLLRLAELCGTPAVHVGRAVEPGTGGRLPSTTMHTGVVVVRVLEASARHEGGCAIAIDADLSELDPAWTEARLIGRASVARAVPTTLTAQSSGCLAPVPIALPGDLCIGDLLALPYAAVTDDAGIARPASGWADGREPAPAYRSAGMTSAAKSSSPERS